MKKIISLVAAVMLLSLSAFAGQETQICTNSIAVNSTNTLAIPTDISGNYTNGQTVSGSTICSGGVRTSYAWLEVGGYFRNTTAQSSNMVFRVAGSVTGSTWTNSAAVINVTVPASSTNYAIGVLPVTNPMPFYSLRTIENVNGAAVTGDAGTCYLKVVSKTGL